MTPDDWLREHAGVPEKIDLGLKRCKKVLALLDLLPAPFTVITVAGTNGKGSTVAFLDAILSEAGLLTGRYSSPHLLRFNERILVAQQETSSEKIISAFEMIQKASAGITLSYFEYATIAALLLFANEQVDVALLEVGLGGRLDACNSIDSDIAVITSIALDHQDWLGDDIEKIAFEKAGIARARKPLILANENLPSVINHYAQSIGSQLIQCGYQYEFAINTTAGSSWTWQDNENELELCSPGLQGDIQIQNAAAAIAALRSSDYWPIQVETINRALQSVKLAGRLQNIQTKGRQWLLDVAHNPASMQVLCNYLIKNLPANKKVSVVFGMLSDKDVTNCINLLSPYIENWHISPLDSPRSLSLPDLQTALIECGINVSKIHANASLEKACLQAQKKSQVGDLILVCGSFYAIGDALSYLESV